MTNVRYAHIEDDVDREAKAIKEYIKKTGKTVIIEWGTTEAMEKTMGAKA